VRRSLDLRDSPGKGLTEPRFAHGMGRREVLPVVSSQGPNVTAGISAKEAREQRSGTACERWVPESALGGRIRLGGRGRGVVAGCGGGSRSVGRQRRWAWISGGGGVVGVEDLSFEYEGKGVSRG
jgi:hypothetical protein